MTEKSGGSSIGKPAEDAGQGVESEGIPVVGHICLIKGGDEEPTEAFERFEREIAAFCKEHGLDLREPIESDVLSQEDVTVLDLKSRQILKHGMDPLAVFGGPDLREERLKFLREDAVRLEKRDAERGKSRGEQV